MERDKLEQKLWDIKISKDGCEILEVLAEFDRLTVRNVNLQTCLDTICEPIRTDGDIGYIKRTVIPLLREQCKEVSAQTLERVLNYLDSQKPGEKPNKEPESCQMKNCRWEKIGDCLDCPENPIKKPTPQPKCEHKNIGAYCVAQGGYWCNDCQAVVVKSLTQCPDCIWGQKRREFTAVEGAYCKYVVYERCPRCKGEGRIPCWLRVKLRCYNF
jgi:hypothetical protein